MITTEQPTAETTVDTGKASLLQYKLVPPPRDLEKTLADAIKEIRTAFEDLNARAQIIHQEPYYERPETSHARTSAKETLLQKSEHMRDTVENLLAMVSQIQQDCQQTVLDFTAEFALLIAETALSRKDAEARKMPILPRGVETREMVSIDTVKQAAFDFVNTLVEILACKKKTFRSHLALAIFVSEGLTEPAEGGSRMFSVRTVYRWLRGGPFMPHTKLKRLIQFLKQYKNVSDENIEELINFFKIRRGLEFDKNTEPHPMP